MRVRVYNKTLCPDLWDENQNLNPEVHKSLITVAKDFYKSIEFSEEPEDILILGSSVGYNWTPQSDIDLHILIDVERERIESDIAREYLNGLAFKWNTEHEIHIKGHKVEVYLQDINEENRSTGVFSLMENQWIRKPCPQRIDIDKEKVQSKFSSIQSKIDSYIESEDVEKLKALMKSIRNYREAGLSREGEFSEENIVFKALRHSGELTRLKDAINDIYDIQRSINESADLPKGVKIWIGTINDDFEINVVYAIDREKTHTEIPNFDKYSDRWRWRTNTNFVFWWRRPDEDKTQAVSDYIKDKTGVRIIRHYAALDFTDDEMFTMHQPQAKLGTLSPWKRKMRETKYDPFESRELWFVTYGGIGPTKQKGYDPKAPEKGGMHYPPARSGFYAFVWPYIEKFLLGGSSFVDPKARGKGARNRLAYVRDKEGNVVSTGHTDYEKLSDRGKNWSLTRTKDNKPEPEEKPEDVAWDDYFKGMLYRPSARKKFKYNGPLWHHLGQWLTPDKIWDRRGEWVKTDMDDYKQALRKELVDMKKTASQHGLSGIRGTTFDHLEVFIDQKV
jgi:hypothetical protein